MNVDKIPGLDYPRLAGMLYNTPLMIHPDKLAVIDQVFQAWLAGRGLQAPAELRRDTTQCIELGALAVREGPTEGKPYTLTEGGTAIIPILGTLVHRADLFDSLSGLTSYKTLQRRIQHAARNSEVKGIALEIDSFGGSVNGLFELADVIMATRDAKPIWTVVNEDAFSAAYAIAAATDRIMGPKTASAGSIGVIAMHYDQSEFDAKRGIKVTHITAGKHKADFSPHQPLADAALARAQSMMDEAYDLFVAHVVNGRDLKEQAVRDTEAQIYTFREAIQLGLADAVATLEDTVTELEATYGRGVSVLLPTRGSRKTTEDTQMSGKENSSAGAPAETMISLAEHQRLLAEASTTARAEGAKSERERIQAVEATLLPGHATLVNALKYDGKTTGPEAALQVLNAEKAKQAGQLKNVEADAAALAGVRSSVSVDGNQGSAGAQAQGYSEEQCKADWDNNKGNCKGDFIDFATYHAYTKAQASGKVKVLGKKAS